MNSDFSPASDSSISESGVVSSSTPSYTPTHFVSAPTSAISDAAAPDSPEMFKNVPAPLPVAMPNPISQPPVPVGGNVAQSMVLPVPSARQNYTQSNTDTTPPIVQLSQRGQRMWWIGALAVVGIVLGAGVALVTHPPQGLLPWAKPAAPAAKSQPNGAAASGNCLAIVTGNVRSAPTAQQQNILSTVAKTALPTTGKQTPGGWIEVTVADNQLGWAHRSVLENAGELEQCLQTQQITVQFVPDSPGDAPKPTPSSQPNAASPAEPAKPSEASSQPDSRSASGASGASETASSPSSRSTTTPKNSEPVAEPLAPKERPSACVVDAATGQCRPQRPPIRIQGRATSASAPPCGGRPPRIGSVPTAATPSCTPSSSAASASNHAGQSSDEMKRVPQSTQP